MKLENLLLLEGKSYKNYWKEKNIKGQHALYFGWNDSPEEFKELIKAGDFTATENNVGQYTDWLIKELKKKMRDYPIGIAKNKQRVKDTVIYLSSFLKSFHNNKEYFKEKNIYNHTVTSLMDEIDEVEDRKATKKMKGAKPIFNFEGWKIIEIKSSKQACELGSGSKWCITAKEHPEEFHQYRKLGPIFFVIKGNRRWAITSSGYDKEYEIYDETDSSIGKGKWRTSEKVPDIINTYLMKRYKD